jgi:hypothetical protein
VDSPGTMHDGDIKFYKNNYIGDYAPLVLGKTVSNVAHSKYAVLTLILNWPSSPHTPFQKGGGTQIFVCIGLMKSAEEGKHILVNKQFR